MRDFELALIEPVDHINLYIDASITSETFKDRKPVRTKPDFSPESQDLSWG
jgi:hypothetical protein